MSATAQSQGWKCAACGDTSTTDTFCDNCGAPRPGYRYDGTREGRIAVVESRRNTTDSAWNVSTADATPDDIADIRHANARLGWAKYRVRYVDA